MATSYSQLSRGSSGKEVKTLQELLNSNGKYNLETDGVFGSKTLAAVQDYQKQKGLQVDGIVGKNTWGALTNASNASAQTPAKAENKAQTAPDYSKYSYDATTDTAYQQALAALQQATAAVPTYQASYDDQLQEIYNQIVNRDKFSYDLNSDALYQQYADQYQLMGQQAMMDTMGQAAALTSGYGNSYANTAGNQAYQAYLQQLNQVVPELYGMALDRYNAEGDQLLTQYSMLGDMADDEYGKYQDALSQYWQNVSLQKQNADDAYDRGYNDFINSYQMGVDADNTAYSRQQAEYEKLVSLITSTGYAPTAAELEAAGMSKDQAAAYSDYFQKQNATTTTVGSSDGSGDTGGDGGTGYDNGSVKRAGIVAMQAALGVTVDGKWGAESQAAAKKLWGTASADDAWEKKGKTLESPAPAGSENTEPEPVVSNVTSEMENKAASFESNDALADYAYGLSDAGIITEDEADALVARHMDPYERYAENDDGSKTISYSQMVQSTSGWKVVDNGGINWGFGVDNNAIVKAPNGEQIRLDNLVDKLVSEGMSKSDAKSYVKKLQKNLDIA